MADPQTQTTPAEKRPLDDVMLAMDVVDTLRHRASLVQRELNAEEREKQLATTNPDPYSQENAGTYNPGIRRQN